MHKEPLSAELGIAGRPLDMRVIALLRALREQKSLAAAARQAGLSYRHAWGELGRISDAIGGPAVALQRGRGAELTPAGIALLDLHQKLDAALAASWPALAKAVRQTHSATAQITTAALQIHASHDFALASLRDLAIGRKIAVQLHFQGSLDALQALAGGNCDVAGFHVAITPPAAAGLGPLAKPLRSRALRLIELATRCQGLMMPRAKAGQINKLADLARNGIRFINRQPGSGTRLLLDRLLAIEGITARNIHGYQDEEFTHAAVAATVASGKADVGFGIEAAARAQTLQFIPVATERYLLGAHVTTLRQPAMKNFCRLLDSVAFTRVLAKLPGYTAAASHAPRTVAETFR